MSDILCDFYLGDCRRCDKRADRNNQQEPCRRPFGRYGALRNSGVKAQHPAVLLKHLSTLPMTEWVWHDAEMIFATLKEMSKIKSDFEKKCG